MNEMVEDEMKNSRVQKPRQTTTKMSLDGFHYRKALREDEALHCALLKKL